MCKLCMTNTLMLALKLPLSKLFACFHVWHIAREDFFIVTTLYLAQRSRIHLCTLSILLSSLLW